MAKEKFVQFGVRGLTARSGEPHHSTPSRIAMKDCERLHQWQRFFRNRFNVPTFHPSGYSITLAGDPWLLLNSHSSCTVKKATSCIQLCIPTVQATMGPGVQAEVSLSVDPRSPWGSCTVEIHWPDGHPMLGFQSRSEHALSSPPLAYISLGHHWPVVGQKKLEKVIIKEFGGLFNIIIRDIHFHHCRASIRLWVFCCHMCV